MALGARLLFTSGQVPETTDGAVPAGFEAQCRLAWRNVEAVLESAGMGVHDRVKVTTFPTDADQASVNRAVREEILRGASPALTVVIARTLEPHWLLDIEAVAARA